MEKVRWRGTWGMGDAMMALNVCHNYCYQNNTKVNLEMHWETEEGHLETPEDPETIVERMEWIHTRYHREEDVTITHVYNSDLFPKGNTNPDNKKKRYYFDSGTYAGNKKPQNQWPFKKKEYKNNIKTKKIIVWTPTYNSEEPRKWKRILTNDDWRCIIKLLRREGWIVVELTYRTPIRDVYKQIQDADYVFCYDGMWHYIARNFATPIFIPSRANITKFHTPQVVCRPDQKSVMEFVSTFTEKGHLRMKKKAKKQFIKNGEILGDR